MILDYSILLGAWVLTLIALYRYIPRKKVRLATIAFLFKQVITFSLGLVVVELGWIEYPIRFFASVSRSSFTYEFFVYPSIGAIFVTNYPRWRSRFYQFGYYVAYSAVLTIFEVLLEKYTNLIKYISWTWYWTFFSLLATFYVTRKFTEWYFQQLLKAKI